jgi:single-strand DNA-binding protein
VAVDRDHVQEGQERETDFIDCVAWRGTGEFVEKYFKKGSMIALKGRLQIRIWTDKDGNKRRSAEIVADNVYFGESKKQDQGGNQSYGQNAFQGYQNQQPQGYGFQAPQQNYQQPQYNAPQYNQQGFGGYQQPGFQGQPYQPPQGGYPVIDTDDPRLPF